MNMNWRTWSGLVAAAGLAASLAACAPSGSTEAAQSESSAVASAQAASAQGASSSAAASEQAASTSSKSSPSSASAPSSSTTDAAASSSEAPISAIDYMVLVNKLHALPNGWEDVIETVHFTNTVGDDVEVEAKAYDAYLALKADLEAEGVHVDLDSARRSVADQQRIMDEFTQEYGADYAKKTVATPGYSEHHTGLALDLYLIIDGVDVVENEDMMQYPQIWEKIHANLADHGFILRYLEGKEHITGYGYEPWHIRYIDDPAVAKEIMDKGITFEGYLGDVTETDPAIDLSGSTLYSIEDLEEAAVQVKCQFAAFEGCELHSLRYGGDEANSEDNIKWLNELDGNANYTQVAEILTDFHSPVAGGGAWEPDAEYTDYQWWLAREEGKGWQLLSWGY